MSTSETARQNKLKSTFSSYKGNKKTGKQYTVGEDSSSSSSSSSSSGTSTPTIKQQTEEERKANMLISDSVDRSKGIDRSKEAIAKLHNSSSSREITESERQALINRYDQSPLRPDLIKDQLSSGAAQIQSIKNGVQQPNRSSSELRAEIVQSQNQQSTSYNPFLKSPEEQLKEADQKEQQEAMDLGMFEETASGYEAHVANYLGPLTGSKYASARFVGGALEAVVLTPTAVPRLVTGLVRNPSSTVQGVVQGTAEQLIEDPARGTGQLVGMVLTGKALGEGAAVIKERLPAISTGEQSFLVKTKIADTAKPLMEQPKPVIQAEFQSTALGQDVFKISEVQSQVGAAAKTQPSMDVLVGETKGGYTDVYLNVDKATAQQLSQKYTGTIENIKTPQGSAVVFEPTAERAITVFEKTDSARIGTPERILLGEESQPGIRTSNPFRIEKRRNLQPGSIELSESAKALPEYTAEVNARGKVVTDFNINDYYKSPEFADPLQLNSGTKLVEQPRPGFFASEEATLGRSRTFTEYKEPAFIGDMPEMQTRYARVKQELTFKEPDAVKSDLSHMQRLYDEAANRGYDPIRGPDIFGDKSARISRTSTPRGSSSPFYVPSTFARSAPSTGPNTSFKTDQIPGLFPNTAPMPNPFADSVISPSPSRKSQYDVLPAAGINAPGTGISSPIMEPLVPVVEEVQTRAKRKNSEFVDPLSDFDRFNKEWKNPVLSGMDILGSTGRRK
jgi:hypothetical protein